jgi:serine/threonine protein phosphatase 1
MSSRIYFAIGDIHGEVRKLAELHAAILDRIAFEKIPAAIVHLGDYVDRGPDSCGVIDRVMALEQRFADDDGLEVVSLMGNHEQMMLHAIDQNPSWGNESWLSQGGRETLWSYLGGRPLNEQWREAIPKAHISWIRNLPDLFRDKEQKLAFVHAGIDPRIFPDCPDQIRLWTRSDRFFNTHEWPDREELSGLTVIHGHTPRGVEPEVEGRRINIDTGACYGGPLTAVMLKDGEDPEFLRAN